VGPPVDKRIDFLFQILDQAYDCRAWHGTNLRGSIRGLSLQEVTWRPGAGRHNIWDIVLHTAYWKYAVRRTLTGEAAGTFPRVGSDWPGLPADSDVAHWKKDVALLRDEHLQLGAALERFPAARLTSKPSGKKMRFEQYIYGAASHDLYHAGQIQLIKRLCRAR
jgi:uncharacterized damage-inducible protein DinB